MFGADWTLLSPILRFLDSDLERSQTFSSLLELFLKLELNLRNNLRIQLYKLTTIISCYSLFVLTYSAVNLFVFEFEWFMLCAREREWHGKKFQQQFLCVSKKKMEITMFNELVKTARWLNTMTHCWPHSKALVYFSKRTATTGHRIELNWTQRRCVPTLIRSVDVSRA